MDRCKASGSACSCFKRGNQLIQLGSLVVQAARCSGTFFNQGGILLGDLIQLGNRITDLPSSLALLLAGIADFLNQG